MKYLLTLIPYPVMYLFGAFVNWNLDEGSWPEMARAIAVIGASAGAMLLLQIILEREA